MKSLKTGDRTNGRVSMGLACLAGAGLLLAGCTYNPATGQRQFLTLSPAQEVALANEAKPQLIAEMGGEMTNPGLRRYVGEVGSHLASLTEADYPQLPWEFTILDSDVINAFALPGGKVFISRGLMARLDSEAQLAGVLGHEIGHVTGQHIDERLSRAMITQYTAEAVGAMSESQVVANAASLLGSGYILTFGRSQEAQADILGVRYMVEAGYDPQGMLGVLQVLDEVSQGSKPPEFLSTHPHPETRIATVTDLLSGEYRYTQNNPDFRQRRERYQREAIPHLSHGQELPPPSPDTADPPDRRGSMYARLGPDAPVHDHLAPPTWCAVCSASTQALTRRE